MTAETIARLLQNSGFYIQKIEDGFLYIEDPSCILRGFQTFLEYAWIALFCVTGLLLFGWAISLIRGATNDYFTNLRNLVIIFGALSAVGPIVNAIWGDDLFAKGCKTVVVSVKEIQKLLAQQKPSSGSGSSGSSSSGGSSTGGGAVSSSGFIYPVPSAYSRITTYMYYSSGQYHGAVDFGSAGINGQPVYAVADGVVVTAKALNYSYGNYVIIAHYNGLYTLYAHGQAGSIRVSEGQRVTQGQQIMNIGSTGNSSGPHLHFEVRVSPGTYDCRRNPMNYLP